MDQQRVAYQMVAERAGRRFLTGLSALPEFKPRPGVDLGIIRVSVTVVRPNSLDIGFVDMDPVNLADLGEIADRRAAGLRAKHAQSKPALRLVGGA
ncbi:hypothetical protein ACL07V_37495 [Streptomyces sp. MB22_4]|uniref:hypothetical protein n=1 Tax=Streptomyces sp. MB22_4 TaxID=3383120 RepID=UPI00399FCC58